jgi:hypothetical protein
MYLSPPAPAPTPLRTILGILLPFLGLAVTYSMWFVTQKVFNNQYRTNVFGYVCCMFVRSVMCLFIDC